MIAQLKLNTEYYHKNKAYLGDFYPITLKIKDKQLDGVGFNTTTENRYKAVLQLSTFHITEVVYYVFSNGNGRLLIEIDPGIPIAYMHTLAKQNKGDDYEANSHVIKIDKSKGLKVYIDGRLVYSGNFDNNVSKLAFDIEAIPYNGSVGMALTEVKSYSTNDNTSITISSLTNQVVAISLEMGVFAGVFNALRTISQLYTLTLEKKAYSSAG